MARHDVFFSALAALRFFLRALLSTFTCLFHPIRLALDHHDFCTMH